MKFLRKIGYFFVFMLFVAPLVSLGVPVKQIHIVGDKKIEKAVILKHLRTKIQQDYSARRVRTDILTLYKLGYFENISVYKKNVTGGVRLTYVIEEKPVISKVSLHGNKEIDTEDIEEVISLKKFSFLDLSEVKKVQDNILNLYTEKGFYSADVHYELVPNKAKNEVQVVYYVSEVDKVQIKKINLIGNKSFSDDELKNRMFTKEKDVWSWITDNGVYQEEVFQRDVQQGLVYFYLMHGYVDIRIHTPQVSISPDKKWLYLTVSIEEGEQFKFGKLDISGDFLDSKNEILKDTNIKSEEIYNQETIRKEISRLTNLYKDKGYAYANVIPGTNINRKKKTVDLRFHFEKGRQVYISRIHIKGNVKTRDKVIRREFRIKEGDLYHESNIQTSLARLHRLGFF